jgi:hypothetical protein
MTPNKPRFQFIADALNGAGVFRPMVTYDSIGKPISTTTTALIRYPRESEEKFARRNDVAWYENHMLSSCRRFVGYLSKKPPARDIGNPLLEDMTADCNWRGDSIDVFFQGFMTEAKARGSMLLLIDMPRSEPVTMAEQIEQRFFPYFVQIAPEAVTRYELDMRGRISLVEISVIHNGKQAIKGWDTESWWVTQDGQEVDGDLHGLGICPVIAFSESGDFPCYGDFAQIADISKRLFNARSELDEILRAQTFSLLHYHVPPDQHDFDTKSVAEAIGTHNMLIHRGDAPGFIAPPEGPATTYLENIARLEEAIKRAALVVEAPEKQTAESGLALTIRFQALNSALTSFARRMEDFERRAWDVACKWLNIEPDRVNVQWAKDYALADLKMELEVLGAMQASGFPEEAIKLQQAQIAALAFSTSEQDDLQTVLDAIGAGAGEVTDGIDPNADPNADPAQNDTNGATGDQQAEGKQSPAPIDLGAVESRLASIEAKISEPKQEQTPIDLAPLNSKVEQLTTAIDQLRNQPIQPQPQTPVIFNTASGAKVIELRHNTDGKLVGAEVREA